ncbi:MAG: ATP-binding protein [bacterium]
MQIPRIYDDIEKLLAPGKVLVIYGPRQVGKTTLVKNYLEKTQWKYRLDQGDNVDLQETLGSRSFSKVLPVVEGLELYVIDEAQKIPHVGEVLKILVDQRPDLRIIATGSSSFELADQVGEPLTGRKQTITLYPLAQMELVRKWNRHELAQRKTDFLVYGSYPRVVMEERKSQKEGLLAELVGSYLFKDVLSMERIKGAKVLKQILQLLAYQIGSTVSYNEIANKILIDVKTVARYLDLLEKTFVITSLPGFGRNLREEVTSQKKYYFWDNGVRNGIIQQFNDLDVRNDVGQLWENFIMIERIKKRSYSAIQANIYFWRTHTQKEIDLVEERGGKLFGYEIKWGEDQAKHKSAWLAQYPGEAELLVINQKNYLSLIV